MKALLVASLFLTTVSSSTLSETLSVEYASFYSHLNKIDSEETPALQFAFGFRNINTNQLCQLSDVKVVTQKVTLDMAVSDEQRFLLPTEKALKQARAVVEIELLEPANQCDMSVQLETKSEYLKKHYSHTELTDLLVQYRAFFDDMGGFMSFLMPDVTGLRVHFKHEDIATVADTMTLTEQTYQIDQAWLAKKQPLDLPVKPLRITAITQE